MATGALMRAGQLFDVYVFVDWSARSAPSSPRPVADAIWIGEQAAGDSAPSETYWRTRALAVAHLHARLVAHVTARRRVLVGWDFPFGYPAGFAEALELTGGSPPWRRTWDALAAAIVDGPNNRNNRLAVAATWNARFGAAPPGPFWGAPHADAATLTRTSPFGAWAGGGGRSIARLRLVDRCLPVQEVWKLLGVGSVGGQALLGIPNVCRLRDAPALAAASAVWPFETGFTAAPTPRAEPFVLHAEVWPGILPRTAVAAAVAAGLVKDQAQVGLLCGWAVEQDSAGQLAAAFDMPPGLAVWEAPPVLAEESWILGASAVRRRT